MTIYDQTFQLTPVGAILDTKLSLEHRSDPYARLSKDQQIQLAVMAKSRHLPEDLRTQAKNDLFLSCLPLVRNIVKRVLIDLAEDYHISEQELVQVGYLYGMEHAWSYYDPHSRNKKGLTTKFSSYMYFAVRQQVQMYIWRQGRVVDRSGTTCDKVAKVSKSRREFLLDNQRFPEQTELEEAGDLTPELITETHEATRRDISLHSRPNRFRYAYEETLSDDYGQIPLDQLIAEEELHEPLAHRMVDPSSASPLDLLLEDEPRDIIARAFEYLDTESQFVLRLYWGIGGEARSYREMEAYFDKTHEAIRQSQLKAFRKLKLILTRMAIEEY
tara:strand:- start:845 stop:1834 length:990 start_codon:yes stop_codon:yes gene_type:complete